MSTASDLRNQALGQETMTADDRLALELAIRAQKLRLEADRRKLATAERLVTELVRLETCEYEYETT